MPLPQLIEEDVRRMDDILTELLRKSEAHAAMIIDMGGFLITQAGDAAQFDTTTLAALAAGSFAANQTIASIVNESNFNSVYQQGENFSILVVRIDNETMVVIVFKAHVSVGAVKYFAVPAVQEIATQFTLAQNRNPDATVDLSRMNLEDTAAFFRRRTDTPQ